MPVEAFGIEKEFLRNLLQEVGDGRAQLPEFQRGWVWPDRNIASLLASISLGYPVGAVMMLRAGGDVRFKQRPVEGATPPPTCEVDRLILDGQQRLTSLYQSITLGRPVETQDVRKRPTAGWFYIDMVAALAEHGDREEAIRFLPADRIVRNFRGEPVEDYSTPEKEYAALLFPVSHLFTWTQWQIEFQKYWGYDTEKIQLWTKFLLDVIQRFEQYQIPVIELGRQTPREAVCTVFEKVNTGGVTLTVFELLTATYAADEFDLRKDWEQRRDAWAAPEYRILREVSNTDFLQAVALLATQDRHRQWVSRGGDAGDARAPRIGCKRTDMLALRLEEYQRWAPKVVEGLKRAAKFLHQQYIYDTKYLPYGTQLIPLSAIFATLGADSEPQGVQEKIARWFWCGVFGELYGGTTETRFSRDLPDVVAWARSGGELPRTVIEATFSPARLLTLRTRGSAAYKGLYALLLRQRAVDWRTGELATALNYFDEAVDIHHIFPRAWCDRAGIDPRVYNSIINKTPLSARTNRVIGGNAPSEYLRRLANSAETSEAQISINVRTHLADPDLMRKDDFDAFFAARERELLIHVGRVMGKPIDLEASERPTEPSPLEDVDDTDEFPAAPDTQPTEPAAGDGATSNSVSNESPPTRFEIDGHHRNLTMDGFDRLWARIEACAGQEFHTTTGLPFVYRVEGSHLTPDRTGYSIHVSQFRKAYDLMPLTGPGQINSLVRGPAYVYAILTDQRMQV
ncbi:DUF262 domain-containing protein [Actinopolymorpha sp. NPDC004070]|uniref:GmrSD restriction endonuclease domain-containing protein n=1 Tax=Actinopolymorpha sp. NPDC004070 TaxID=3154548 RepID=UPI0033B78822